MLTCYESKIIKNKNAKEINEENKNNIEGDFFYLQLCIEISLQSFCIRLQVLREN